MLDLCWHSSILSRCESRPTVKLKCISPNSIKMANHHKKIGIANSGKNDILSLCEYEQAIVGNEGLESFRRKHRYGVYIFKIQNHRIVSAEGQPKIFGQL